MHPSCANPNPTRIAHARPIDRGRVRTTPGPSFVGGWLAVALFLFLVRAGVTTSSHGASLVHGPDVALNPNGTALVIWRTDVPTGARVLFGLTPTALSRRADGSNKVAELHSVTLTDLRPGTRYYYAVGTARVLFATNTFQTPGSASTRPTAGRAPPASETWGHLPSLRDHFERHGRDFRAQNPEDYARLAWEFLQRGRQEKFPAKLDEAGTLRVYEPRSGAFAAYNPDGTTKTFFKPRSLGYFDRQPGRSVNLPTHTFVPRSR